MEPPFGGHHGGMLHARRSSHTFQARRRLVGHDVHLTSSLMDMPDDRKRFELELEFINSLANPAYLQWLAQTYGIDASFVEYLQYLEYWRQPQYAKYIIYPHALHFLNLLQRDEFRTAVASASVRELIENQQFFMWQHFRQNRERSSQAAVPVTRRE